MMEQSLIPHTPVLPLTAQRTVKRALTLLDRHLRETGVAFTSTQAARDWLKLKWRDWSAKSLWCFISISRTS